MADMMMSDYHSGQLVDSLAGLSALRYQDVRVGGSIPGLDCYKGKHIAHIVIQLHRGKY